MIQAQATRTTDPNPKGHSRFSIALGTVTCPRCRKKGSLKLRVNGYTNCHVQIDHYKTSWHGDGYLYSCYLDMYSESRVNVQSLKADRKNIRRKLIASFQESRKTLKAHSV